MLVIVTAVVVGALSLSLKPTAGQAADTSMARMPDGKPNVTGVWQALNEANWDLEAHASRAALIVQPGPVTASSGDHHVVPGAPALALGAIGGVPGGLSVVEDGEIPYQPWALERRKENQANLLTRDPEVKCYMPGIPRAMYMPYPFHIVQSTNKIMMIYEFAAAQRVIHMDDVVRPVNETWMGHSAGRWEGDTLVVDVTRQVENTWFDRAGNFHSDALHLVERFTPVSANHLDYELTVEDPKVFTRPWKIRMPLYRRLEPNAQILEYKCVEFVEELMYGHLRQEQLVRRWESPTLVVDVTRKVPPVDQLYER
jgi:hypothetical protein